MKVKMLMLGFGCVLLTGLFPGVAGAAKVDIGGDRITIATSKAEKPALFPHRSHQQTIACMVCHHTKERTMTVDKCQSCHNEGMPDEKLNSLKGAGHALCTGCHKQSKDEAKPGAKTGPVNCGACHPEKDDPSASYKAPAPK